MHNTPTSPDWLLISVPEGIPSRPGGGPWDCERCPIKGSRQAVIFSASSSLGMPTLRLCARHFAGAKRTWAKHGLVWELADHDDPRVAAARTASAARGRELTARMNEAAALWV